MKFALFEHLTRFSTSNMQQLPPQSTRKLNC